MKKIILSLTASVFLLSGCGIYSSYKPVEEVEQGIYGDINVAMDSTGLGYVEWKEFFTDTKLQSIIERALENNTDLKSARLRVESAEASLMAANLSFLPGFSLSPQGTLSSFDNSAALKSYTLPISASWQVDVFGSLLNARRSTKMTLEQTKALEQATRSQLIATVANYYYTILMLDKQLSITEETQLKWKESVRVAKALKEAGQYNEAGVAQTEATYYNVCNSVEDLRLKLRQAENGLSLLIAETPQIFEKGDIDQQYFPESFMIGVPLSLLSNRPDVRSAEFALGNAFYGVNSARSAFYPVLNLSGTIGWTNNLGQVIMNPGKLIETAVASITQPLFNKGTNIANLKIAKNQLEISELNFKQTLLKAGSEVNDAIITLQNAKSKRENLDLQLQSLEKAVKSTQLLMRNGSTNYLEVLTSEQTLLSAKLSNIANRFAEIQSMVNLYQTLGGGN